MCTECRYERWIDVLKEMLELDRCQFASDFLNSVLDFADDKQHLTAKQIKAIRKIGNGAGFYDMPDPDHFEDDEYRPPMQLTSQRAKKPPAKTGKRTMTINRMPRLEPFDAGGVDLGPLSPGD